MSIVYQTLDVLSSAGLSQPERREGENLYSGIVKDEAHTFGGRQEGR